MHRSFEEVTSRIVGERMVIEPGSLLARAGCEHFFQLCRAGDTRNDGLMVALAWDVPKAYQYLFGGAIMPFVDRARIL